MAYGSIVVFFFGGACVPAEPRESGIVFVLEMHALHT